MARNNTPVDKNSREYLLRQVANGLYSLLLIVILTVVNLIMTILDTNTYFLFSASVPYYLVFVGMGIENGFVDGAWNVKGTLTYTGLVIALVYLWPVLLIGSHSVMPSTTPSTMALSISIIKFIYCIASPIVFSIVTDPQLLVQKSYEI